MEKELLIQLKNITKRFGRKVVANDKVSLDLYKGEILSLLGENGSGKTSLMNILAGIYHPDAGSILINGKRVTITSPEDAFKYKIGMVHQHFKLVDVFSAAENVVLGLKGKDEKFNLKASKEKIKNICADYGFKLDPNKKVCDMSVSEKQTLEIIKTLYRGVDILILDEPTAVLTPQEISKLFKIIRNMKEAGKSIIIITHKLNEVMDISDRITVLRKGQLIGTVEKENTTIEELTEMMVGKRTELNINRSEPKGKEILLDVNKLSVKNSFGTTVIDKVSFTLKEGEILGIAGISGNGQRELLEAIGGVRPIQSGDVIFYRQKKNKPVTFIHKSLKEIKTLARKRFFHDPEGNPVTFRNKTNREIRKLVNSGQVLFNENEAMRIKGKDPLEVRELGIHLAFVPEDRLGMGLVGTMDIDENMMLRSYKKGKPLFLDFKKPHEVAENVVEELEVAASSTKVQIRKLSGGNVQKVLVGREIAYSPSVFMVAYPVRGLDINSSYTIYNLLNKQKEKGVGVVYVGEDLDVLLDLCDRILVLCDGKVNGILDARKTTKTEIGALMLGD